MEILENSENKGKEVIFPKIKEIKVFLKKDSKCTLAPAPDGALGFFHSPSVCLNHLLSVSMTARGNKLALDQYLFSE